MYFGSRFECLICRFLGEKKDKKNEQMGWTGAQKYEQIQIRNLKKIYYENGHFFQNLCNSLNFVLQFKKIALLIKYPSNFSFPQLFSLLSFPFRSYSDFVSRESKQSPPPFTLKYVEYLPRNVFPKNSFFLGERINKYRTLNVENSQTTLFFSRQTFISNLHLKPHH